MSTPVGDSIRRHHRGRGAGAAWSGPHWGKLLLLGVLGALAAFGLGYALAVFVLFPAPAAAAPGIVVPALVGQDTTYAQRALAARGLRLGSVSELPDPRALPGAVVAQDAMAGQQLRRGAPVNVAVSSGPARATLPNVSGYTAPRAAALLAALGFQVSQELVPADVPAGQVVRVSPAPGLAYELPAGVLLAVSSGPPPVDSTAAAAPDSLATDTAAHASPPATHTSPPAARTPAPPTRPPAPEQPGNRKL